MKKFIFILLSIISMNCFGQTFKQGWKINTLTDTYTQNTIYVCNYYDNYLPIACFYPSINKLLILKEYSGLQYFDQTWNALLYNNGKIKSYETNVEERFIYDNDYKEYDNNILITFSEVKKSGENFYGKLMLDENIEDLKKAKSVSYRYYDNIEKRNIVMNISLIGFTKCYNQVPDNKKMKDIPNEEENNEESEVNTINDEDIKNAIPDSQHIYNTNICEFKNHILYPDALIIGAYYENNNEKIWQNFDIEVGFKQILKDSKLEFDFNFCTQFSKDKFNDEWKNSYENCYITFIYKDNTSKQYKINSFIESYRKGWFNKYDNKENCYYICNNDMKDQLFTKNDFYNAKQINVNFYNSLENKIESIGLILDWNNIKIFKSVEEQMKDEMNEENKKYNVIDLTTVTAKYYKAPNINIKPYKKLGLQGISQYIANNYKRPKQILGETKVAGKIVISYIIGEDGKIYCPRIIKSLNKEYDNELIKELESLNNDKLIKITSAKYNNENISIRVTFTLNI